MPAPLIWNSPGLKWSSGATWNGTAASKTKTKTMSNVKAIIDFSGYTAAELGPASHSIHDKMTLNAATFTTPAITMRQSRAAFLFAWQEFCCGKRPRALQNWARQSRSLNPWPPS